MATRIMLGEPLKAVLPTRDVPTHVAVKVPVFPFNKFKGSDPKLGPEMRSTGEVMGIDKTFALAFAKAQVAAGQLLPKSGQVFISVNNTDKPEALKAARDLAALGFTLVATSGTAQYLSDQGLSVTTLLKKHEGEPHIEHLIAQGQIQLIINTPAGEEALTDDSYIRKAAVLFNIPYATTLTGARAIVDAIGALQNQSGFSVCSIQEYLAQETPVTA